MDSLTLYGYVLDDSTRTPLSDVQIGLDGGSLGALTDDSGRYQLRVPQSGRYRLFAQRISYRPDQFDVVVRRTPVRVDFALPMEVTPSSDCIVATGDGQYRLIGCE